jgi:hypothetical protein
MSSSSTISLRSEASADESSSLSITLEDDFLPPPPASHLPSTLRGAWEALADAEGLNTAAKGPMSLAMDHEKLVVGTSGGDVYVVGMVGYRYRGDEGLEALESESGEEGWERHQQLGEEEDDEEA